MTKYWSDMKMKRIVKTKKSLKLEKATEQRSRKVKFVYRLYPNTQALETSSNPNKMPIGQIISAANQFTLGYFENSVLNSAFAVEYALLFKINSEINAEEKQEIAQKLKGGFDLRYALNLARGKWIDETLYNRLQLLNNLRDMCAHPSNWVTLYNLLNKQYGDKKEATKMVCKALNMSINQITESLKGEFEEDKGKQTVEAMLSYADSRWANLPDLEWASKKGTLLFQRDFVKSHSEQMIKDMILKKEIVSLIQKPSAAAERILNRYRFPEEIALISIRLAFEALQQLQIR